jgi:hypothetical protein
MNSLYTKEQHEACATKYEGSAVTTNH